MRHLVIPRRVATAALSGVLLLGAAGCAGSVTVTSTSTAAAPTGTAPAATATVPMPSATLAGGTASAGQPPITGHGVPGVEVADAIRAAVSSATSVALTFTTQAGPGQANVDLAHKAVSLTVGAEASPVRLVHVGGATYVRGAGTQTLAPSPSGTATPAATTRRWLQLRSDGSDVLSRKLGAAADVEAMLRPAAFADMFENLLGDETPVDGGRRVSFWVPADAYVAAVHGGPALAASLTKPVVVLVELDSSNHPTRLTATMTSDKSTIVDDTRYTRWNGPVDITAPDPADIAPAPLPGEGGRPSDAGPGDGPTASGDPEATPGSTAGSTPGTTPTRRKHGATTTVTVTATATPSR